jgi:hypothetical protein
MTETGPIRAKEKLPTRTRILLVIPDMAEPIRTGIIAWMIPMVVLHEFPGLMTLRKAQPRIPHTGIRIGVNKFRFIPKGSLTMGLIAMTVNPGSNIVSQTWVY